ncbi:lipopolysaccharide biosynthesis protein [Actinopolymorpha alba]|uniref:lipopolysaccharide biosynthesis protein n=1 Tax=Actinopolymorpha alba TaxID=533267 RepID=UPI00035E2727|nr:lipopolysaccharide biosynthesis protein [Actinopolymorpha alba]
MNAPEPRGETGDVAGVASPERPSLTGRLVRGTLWSMLGIAALGLTRLIYTALVGRTSDPSRLAEINSQISLAFLATFATAAATGAGAAKFLPLTMARSGPAAASAVRRTLTRWTVVATCAVVVLIGVLGRWLLPDAALPDLVWVCALTAAYGAYSYSKSVLYGYHLPGRYAVLEVFSDAAILVLALAAIWWLPDLLLAPLVIGYAAFAVAAARSTPRDRPGPMPELGRELPGFVAYTALGIAAGQGFFQVSMVVARHAASGQDAGAYAAAMSLITPAFFLPRAMALAFFPAAAEAVGRDDTPALARHTDVVTRLLALTMLPAFALAAMLGGLALRLVFGPAYAGGGAVFAVLVLAVFLYVVAVPSVNVLSAHELALARIPPLASTVGVVAGTVVWLTLGSRLGAVGVAAGYLAGMLIQAGVPLVVAFHRLGLWSPARFARYALSLGAGIALAALAVLDSRPWVVAGCVVGFCVVFGLLLGGEVRKVARALPEFRKAVTRP